MGNNLTIEADYQHDEVTENNNTNTGESNGSLDIRNDFISGGEYDFYTSLEYNYDELSTSGINTTHQYFQMRYITLL